MICLVFIIHGTAPTNPPLDYLMFINILEDDNGNFGELGRTLDGCSRPIYMNEGFPFGSRSETILRVSHFSSCEIGCKSVSVLTKCQEHKYKARII